MTPRLLFRVHAVLDAADVRSALIGATALAVHGVTRSTLDQDLLVTDPRVLERQTWRALADIAGVDVRRGDAADPLAGVVRVTAHGERDVDVIVGRHEWQRQLIAEASPVLTPGGSIPVVSPSGLVLLKLYAGGPQDFWDIEQLRAIAGPALDAVVERQVEMLPAAAQDAWRRLTTPR